MPEEFPQFEFDELFGPFVNMAVGVVPDKAACGFVTLLCSKSNSSASNGFPYKPYLMKNNFFFHMITYCKGVQLRTMLKATTIAFRVFHPKMTEFFFKKISVTFMTITDVSFFQNSTVVILRGRISSFPL